MTQIAGGGVTLIGTHDNSSYLTFLISGSVDSTCVGKAVTQDSTTANTVKLCGDGDLIVGKIVQFEDRVVEGVKVVSVMPANGARTPMRLTYTGAAPTLGASVVGSATAGVVKASTAIVGNRVWEVDTGTTTVVVTLPG